MTQFRNPSNSHVLNTLYFNAGQFRDCTVDVIGINKRTNVNSFYLKKIFNISTLDTKSNINSKSIRVRNILNYLSSSSSLNCLGDIIKLRKIFISIVPFNASSSIQSTYVRLKNNFVSLSADSTITSSIRRSISPSLNFKSKTDFTYKVTRRCYTSISPIKITSSFGINYFGFLLYYKGKLKTIICHKSAPHHPAILTYRVRGKEYSDKIPFNATSLNSNVYNAGFWVTQSYHFDTEETVKDNTVINLCTKKEPEVIKCSSKPIFFF